MTFDFFKRFRTADATNSVPAGTPAYDRFQRTSSGLKEFSRLLGGEEPKVILDLGPTSSSNLMRFTDSGHKIYSEDVLLAAQDPTYQTRDASGATAIDAEKFFADNLKFPSEHFDVVLCWDLPDYLPEPLVKALVDRLHSVTRPGGSVLAFFHTRDAGADVPYHRYHIKGTDLLELEPVPKYRLQRIFNNRHIENLFKDFNSIKFFLARDFIREVLIVR